MGCSSASKSNSQNTHAGQEATRGTIERAVDPVIRAGIHPEQTFIQFSSDPVQDASILRVDLKTEDPPPKGVQFSFELAGTDPVPFFKLNEQEFQAVVGIPYMHPEGKTPVVVRAFGIRGPDGKELPSVELKRTIRVVSGKYRSERLRVDPSKVSPPKKVIPRILKEKEEIDAAYASSQPNKYWQGAFDLPVQSKVTSPFGTKRVFNGQLKGFHKGLDLRAPTGTPIRAPAPGRVVLAKNLYFTGNTVILDHGHGVMTLYAHFSKTKVRVGQLVQPNEVLGLSGSTGRVSGPHLHWGAIIHGIKVNPQYLTEVMR